MEPFLSVLIIVLVGAVLMLSMENFAKHMEIKRLEDEIYRRDSEDNGSIVVVEGYNTDWKTSRHLIVQTENNIYVFDKEVE